jgi:hypothetical protein
MRTRSLTVFVILIIILTLAGSASTAAERGFERQSFAVTLYNTADLLDSLLTTPYTTPIDFRLECFGEPFPSLGCELIAELADGANWSARWQGTLIVPSDGDYTFRFANVDDGARLILDGNEIVDNGWYFPNPNQRPSPQVVSLTAGEHDIIIHYEQRVPGAASLQVRWAGPTFADEVIPMAGPPPFTTSLYMTNEILTDDLAGLDHEKLNELGCLAALQVKHGNALVILDFGDPAKMETGSDSVEYGTILVFTGPFVSTTEIFGAAQDFIRGFQDCSASFPTAHLTLAIGTNNSGIVFNAGQDAIEHGKAWGNLVNDVHDWIVDEGYARRVSVAAASDIEKFGNRDPNISDADRCRLQQPYGHCTEPEAVRQWLEQYLQATAENKLRFYNYGACENCSSAFPLEPGVDDWYRAEYVHLSWDAEPGRVYPIPEIYGPSDAHAVQWRNLMRFALEQQTGNEQYRRSVFIPGTLTQCRIINPFAEPVVCTNINTNKPVAGWQQMYDALSADTTTAYAASLLIWSTDIINLNAYKPIVVSIDVPRHDTAIPYLIELSQNYPNPFNPETVIRFELPEALPVRLTIYNLVGQAIRRLVTDTMPAGVYQITWNGRDDSGRQVASGVYLYRIQAGDFNGVKKLMLLR